VESKFGKKQMQTSADVATGQAIRSAFPSEMPYCNSTSYNIVDGNALLLQVWYDKTLSLLKDPEH
jgi:hypothetical protein